MASIIALFQGTTRGGFQSARIFVYKVCWSIDCFYTRVFATFEREIHYGIFILSVSLESKSKSNINHYVYIQLLFEHSMICAMEFL